MRWKMSHALSQGNPDLQSSPQIIADDTRNTIHFVSFGTGSVIALPLRLLT
jgi:hypothetical protein